WRIGCSSDNSQLPTSNSQAEPVEASKDSPWELGVGSWELTCKRSSVARICMKRVVGTGLVAMATAATLSAENWPQWRGPAKNGVSTERGLPLKWSTTENVAWKLAMPGRSGSTPIIWGETIFLNIGTADRSGDLEVWALDRGDGRIRWKKHIAGGNHVERKQNMSSPSPVTDGQTVWVMT